MISVIIQDENKRITRLQAIGNGHQFELSEEICIAGNVSGVKKYGLIAREKGQDCKSFALQMIQKACEGTNG